MNREFWEKRNLDGMLVFFGMLGDTAAGGRTLRREGLVASISPGTPRYSMPNSVIYDDPAALAAALPEITAAYEDAGVAWTVWVPDRDFETRALLIEAGHQLDTSPRLMGRSLEDLEPHSMEGIAWEQRNDPAAVNAVNEIAYGIAPGGFVDAMGAIDGEGLRHYIASHDGEPAATVGTLDVGEDCAIFLVATVPEARGTGISTALMRQALADARGRGLKTTTLQASKLGRPVYVKTGYEDHGCFEMWERRDRDAD